jgi:hypothetical protein
VVLHTAGFSGSWDTGSISVTLWNAGLGTALRVEVGATYEDPDNPDIHPEIESTIWPAFAPSSSTTFSFRVRFSEEPPGGVFPDGFRIHGTIATVRNRTCTRSSLAGRRGRLAGSDAGLPTANRTLTLKLVAPVAAILDLYPGALAAEVRLLPVRRVEGREHYGFRSEDLALAKTLAAVTLRLVAQIAGNPEPPA